MTTLQKAETGDVLYGGKIAPWSKFWIRIVQEAIRIITGGKSHVMLVLYANTQTEKADDYVIFEFTWPRAQCKIIDKLPETYTLHRNPDGFKFSPTCFRQKLTDDNGQFYDFLELIDFLKGKKIVTGISSKHFVCSTGIQHVMRECGYDPWSDKSAVPKDFGDWPEVK